MRRLGRVVRQYLPQLVQGTFAPKSLRIRTGNNVSWSSEKVRLEHLNALSTGGDSSSQITLKSALALLEQGDSLKAADQFSYLQWHTSGGRALDDGIVRVRQALHKCGLAAYRNDELEIGLEFFQKIVAIDPNDAMAIGNVARCLRKLGRLVEAREFAVREIELATNPSSDLTLARIDWQEELIGTAIKAYKKIIDEDPSFVFAQYDYAKLLIILGRTKQALYPLGQLLSKNHRDAQALTLRGYLYVVKGEYPRARADFEAALKIESGSREARKGLEGLTGEPSLASSTITMSPEYDLSLLIIVSRLKKEAGRAFYADDRAKAIELNQKALAINPFDEFVLFKLAELHLEVAEGIFSSLLAKDPILAERVANLKGQHGIGGGMLVEKEAFEPPVVVSLPSVEVEEVAPPLPTESRIKITEVGVEGSSVPIELDWLERRLMELKSAPTPAEDGEDEIVVERVEEGDDAEVISHAAISLLPQAMGFSPIHLLPEEEVEAELARITSSFRRAEGLRDKGDLPAALELYAQILAKDKGYQGAVEGINRCIVRLLEQVVKKVARGELASLKGARVDLDRALKAKPDDEIVNKALELVVKELDEPSALDPEQTPLIDALKQLFGMEEEAPVVPEVAEEELVATEPAPAEFDSTPLSVSLADAQQLIRTQKFSKAIPPLKQVLTKDSRHVDAARLLYTAFLESGKRDELVPYFEELLEKDRRNVVILFTLGRYYLAFGEEEKAVGFFQAAVQIRRNNPEALNFMAQAYVEFGSYTKALARYQEALRLNSSYMSAQLGMGETYLGIGNFGEAQRWFRQVLEKDASQPRALEGLARICYEQKKYDEALLILKKATVAKRENLPIRKLKADILREQRRLDEAIREYEEVLAKVGASRFMTKLYLAGQIEAITGLGLCDIALGEESATEGQKMEHFRNALVKFKQALSLAVRPDRAVAQVCCGFGIIYLKLMAFYSEEAHRIYFLKEAVGYLDQAIKIEPKNKLAQEKRRQAALFLKGLE